MLLIPSLARSDAAKECEQNVSFLKYLTLSSLLLPNRDFELSR